MRCWRSLEEQIQKEALEQKRFWEGRGWDHIPIDDDLHALAEASRKYDGEPTTTAPHAMPALEKWAKKYGSTIDAMMATPEAMEEIARDAHEKQIPKCPHGIPWYIGPCGLCAEDQEQGGVPMKQLDAPVDGEVKCLACGKALNRTDKNCYACGSTKLSEFDDATPAGEVFAEGSSPQVFPATPGTFPRGDGRPARGSSGDSNSPQIPDSWHKEADTLRRNTIKEFEEYLKRTASPTPVAPPNNQGAGPSLGPLGPSVRRTYWVDPLCKVDDRASSGLTMDIDPLVMEMIHGEAQRLDVLFDARNFTLLHCFSGGRLASNISMRRAMDIGTRIEAILVQEGF